MSETEQMSEVEREARSQGWVPKEQYRSNPDEWVDAETFVQRGKEINSILRANNERLKKEISDLRSTTENMKVAFKEVERMQKAEKEREVAALQEELNDLRVLKKQAIKDADGDAVVEIDEQIDAVKEKQREAKKPTEEAKPAADDIKPEPETAAWLERNEWFGKDVAKTQLVQIVGNQLVELHPELRGHAFFDKLDEELRDRFPEKFGGPSTPRSPVERASRKGEPTSSKDTHTFEKLPQYAKEAYQNMVNRGQKITKQQYVEFFDWDE